MAIISLGIGGRSPVKGVKLLRVCFLAYLKELDFIGKKTGRT
jgi:hypothetical protein